MSELLAVRGGAPLTPFVQVMPDDAQLRAFAAQLAHIRNGTKTALVRAINRTIRHMRRVITNQLMLDYQLPRKAIQSRQRMTLAFRATLAAAIRLWGRGLSLWWYRPVKGPVGAEFSKGDVGVIAHSFIAKMHPGQTYPGVYIRTTRKRFPLRFLRTEPVPSRFTRLGGQERFILEARDFLLRRMAIETQLLLSGRRGVGRPINPFAARAVEAMLGSGSYGAIRA